MTNPSEQTKKAAETFMSLAICEWGQSDEVRIKAVQGVLDAAGFNAKAVSRPVFGGIWPKPCDGAEGKEATEFLQKLTDTMKRGKFEIEVEHVKNAILARQKP